MNYPDPGPVSKVVRISLITDYMLLIKNIKKLVQVEDSPKTKVAGTAMADLPSLDNAWLLIKNGLIDDFGRMDSISQALSDIPFGENKEIEEIDAAGRLVFPSFCDSHTHLVYAGSREIEYIDKIKGLSYEEIAKRGGGILNSAKLLQQTSEDDLYEQSLERVNEIIKMGTGAVEIKSGYGLTLDDEIKMLRVIKRLKDTTPLVIRSSFLGAHALPAEYKGNKEKYVDLVINEMIPRVAEEGLADYIDVFCDRGFFSVEDTDRILEAGKIYKLRGKIHANELDYSGGIQAGVRHNALSVDHLEFTGREEIEALLKSDTMPALLPGTAFFLGMEYPPARKMIEAGLPLALASDYNPGSSPSGNMKFIMSLGCIKLRMIPEEVVNAVTINGAYAMGVEKEVGSVARGKRANIFITKKISGYEFMPYAYGSDLVDKVILRGQIKE